MFIYLISEGSELFLEGLEVTVVQSGGSLLLDGGLLFPELVGSFLSLAFELFDDSLALPTIVSAQITEEAELSEVLESDDLQSSRDDLSLLSVIGAWNTFESLESA